MKKYILLFIPFLFWACSTSKSTTGTNTVLHSTKESGVTEYANVISVEDLKTNLYTLSSDEFQGRKLGEKGQKEAARFIAQYYKDIGILPLQGYEDYLQKIPKDFFKDKSNSASENVLAFIRGSEKAEEVVVITAHYDHLGLKGNEIYNGADDDGSGTVAVMEIAKAFHRAKQEGNGPKRSVLFLHLTGEEEGLFGSKYYISHPIFPLDYTVANLNIDMIGRVDQKHRNKPDYIYLIGSDKLSSELHRISERVNREYTQLDIDYTFNEDTDPNRFYYRSDHYNFAKNRIPVIFYFNGTHEDYHQTTDTADKINYELLAKRAQLIFYTAWEIANREGRLIVDKK